EDHRRCTTRRQLEKLCEPLPFGEQAPKGNREVVLGRDVDLEVGRSERAVDLTEGATKIVAQRFAHRLTANCGHAVVLSPVERRLVDKDLQERRIAADQIPVAWTEEPERLLDLRDVGSRRLEDRNVD